MVEIPSIDLDMRRWLKNLLVQIFGRPRGARILDKRDCSPAPHFLFVAPLIVLMGGNFHF
jgi:hypothetical protein